MLIVYESKKHWNEFLVLNVYRLLGIKSLLKRQLTFCYTKVNIMKLVRGLDAPGKTKKQSKASAAPANAENSDKIVELIQNFSSLYLKGNSHCLYSLTKSFCRGKSKTFSP